MNDNQYQISVHTELYNHEFMYGASRIIQAPVWPNNKGTRKAMRAASKRRRIKSRASKRK